MWKRIKFWFMLQGGWAIKMSCLVAHTRFTDSIHEKDPGRVILEERGDSAFNGYRLKTDLELQRSV